jgi:hypothetical protein
LCGGIYTSSDWQPKAEVPFQTSIGIQGESSGIMTGTEGWVKYNLVRDDGTKRALVYLYWTNPWLGTTDFNYACPAIDIVADCDEDSTSVDSSVFSDANTQPSDLILRPTAIWQDGLQSDLNDPGELYKLLPRPAITVPVYMIGGVGVYSREEVTMEISSTDDGGSILLPPPSTRTKTLDTNPAPDILSGSWAGDAVTVTITRNFDQCYRVVVSDQTPGRR